MSSASAEKAPPSWRTMPNKDQLAILMFSRIADFFQIAVVQTVMVEQLRSFDPEIPSSTISYQAGIVQAAFTGCQVVSSAFWGYLADKPWCGRKLVLEIGLVGTAVTCLGVAFSQSFLEVVAWRTLAGILNATVGSARAMISENVEKPFLSRAFLLLPLAFNIANIIGPLLGGVLANPAKTFSTIFGPHSLLGGAEGVRWMKDFPFALPNILSVAFLLLETAVVIFFLNETLTHCIQGVHWWSQTSRILRKAFNGKADKQYAGYKYDRMEEEERGDSSDTLALADAEDNYRAIEEPHSEKPVERLPFSAVWTKDVIINLLSIFIFDFHMGAFIFLWVVYLSTSRSPPGVLQDGLNFNGGLGFNSSTIGLAMSIIGVVGVLLQFLLYPPFTARYGVLKCFRVSLLLFPLSYGLAPLLSSLPSDSSAPYPASGVLIWLGIIIVVLLQVAARTFALPATVLLLNNASPHSSVLGTLFGIGQSCSAAARTAGPIVAGLWYSYGLEHGNVILPWWLVAGVSALGCVVSLWVKDASQKATATLRT